MYRRIFDIENVLQSKSILLLGPRQTGKSTLVNSIFPKAFNVNLAESDTFRSYLERPELLRQRLPDNCKYLIIDEAQLLPELFNEAQVIIDRNKSIRVVLTGSSARKLKRGDVNLLPGRIWKRNLHPLVSPEIKNVPLDQRLLNGGLPAFLESKSAAEELRNYVGLYLEEEIRAEGLTRSVGNFSRFLKTAALTNAEQINFTSVSNDTGVKLNTVRSYYQILEDTLLGHQLEPYRGTKKRKAVSTPKFYFFDTGVVNGILGRTELIRGTHDYGKLLEQLIFLELKAYVDYQSPQSSIDYWRSLSKLEVDFLINKSTGIEVKASSSVTSKDEIALHSLAEDILGLRKIIVCHEQFRRKTDSGVEVYPVEEFFTELWDGGII